MSADIVAALKCSRKYRFICEEALDRVARSAAKRHSGTKAAVKAAKRRLHQAVGAYLGGFDPAGLGEAVEALPEAIFEAIPERPQHEPLRRACLGILKHHASTRERIPVMREAFEEIFRRTGAPRAVVDLACGLGPFALPWMGLGAGARYHAVDIDSRIVSAANAFFARAGLAGTAACADVLCSVPDVEADVVLLLKSLPCLERQERGAGARLLRELSGRARHVVISFPARSLGGEEKGMRGSYREYVSRIAAELRLACEELAYPSETFYVLSLPSKA